MRTLAKIIGYGLVILLVAAAIGFTYKYTNGFNEDFKTFYIEHDGKQILTTDSKMTFEKGGFERFDVKYTFDKDDTEPKDYKVKIVPNITRDFDYVLDDEKCLYSKTTDFTAGFDIDKHETYFTLDIPENCSLAEVLKKTCKGTSIIVPADAETNNPYPYKLVISSYNDKISYNVLFSLGGVTSSGGTQNETPTETAKSYAITMDVKNNEQGLVYVSSDLPSSAKAGDTVEFVVQPLSDYHCNVAQIKLYANGVFYANALSGDGDYAYKFVMPDFGVKVEIWLTDIEISNFHSISYDTLGSGSNLSVMFYCNDVAAPGDWVTASMFLTPDEENRLEITNVVLENADTGEEIEHLENFNDLYEFTMPDCDVVIMIYLMPKDNQSGGTVETPTTPTGATYSIIYSATYGDYDSAFDFTDFVTVDCPSTVVSGEKVTVQISIMESFAELYEITDVMISYPEMEFSYDFAVSKGNGVYEFTMPDFDIQLYIYVGDKSYM